MCSQLPLPVTVAASSASTDELTKATDGSWLTTSAGFRVSSFLGKVGKVPLVKQISLNLRHGGDADRPRLEI